MKVVALPNKNLAYSNRCYTKEIEGYYMIKDLPVLLEKYDTLSSNMIGMSSFIRDYLKVNCEEVVEIKKTDKPNSLEFVECDIKKVARFRDTVNEVVLEKEFKSRLKGTVVKKGLKIGLFGQPEMEKCILTVEILSNESGVVDEKTSISFSTKDELLNLVKAKKQLKKQKFDPMQYGIAGLDRECSEIFNRAFKLRFEDPEKIKARGLKHTQGVLLYGPPGTGKTTIARAIGTWIGARVVFASAPELLDKYVGESERKLRELYKPAISDYDARKENADLYLIIIDEIDCLCQDRSVAKTGSSLVTQFLTILNGIKQYDNFITIGTTNRRNAMDEALLRDGRFEVQIHVPLPDLDAREKILDVYLKNMRDCNLAKVDSRKIAEITEGYSGANLEGLVREAVANLEDLDTVLETTDLESIVLKRKI